MEKYRTAITIGIVAAIFLALVFWIMGCTEKIFYIDQTSDSTAVVTVVVVDTLQVPADTVWVEADLDCFRECLERNGLRHTRDCLKDCLQ
jgi:hypothetical protein